VVDLAILKSALLRALLIGYSPILGLRLLVLLRKLL